MNRYTKHEPNYGQTMKPCPWCEEIPVIAYSQGSDDWSYGCRNSNCPTQPGYYDHSPKDCATEWNKLTNTLLANCPWCGKEAELQIQGEYYVTCPNEWCVIQPSTWGHSTSEEAWAHWNTRKEV